MQSNSRHSVGIIKINKNRIHFNELCLHLIVLPSAITDRFLNFDRFFRFEILYMEQKIDNQWLNLSRDLPGLKQCKICLILQFFICKYYIWHFYIFTILTCYFLKGKNICFENASISKVCCRWIWIKLCQVKNGVCIAWQKV